MEPQAEIQLPEHHPQAEEPHHEPAAEPVADSARWP